MVARIRVVVIEVARPGQILNERLMCFADVLGMECGRKRRSQG